MRDIIKQAIRRLRDAEQSKKPCEPIRDLIGADDVKSAYEIQSALSDIRKEEGARKVGSKIGLTSNAIQTQLGVDQPDFGMLWHDKEILNGGEIEVSEMMQPKAEAEIAFVLSQDLNFRNLTTVDIISSIDYALASIEIVGSRIKDWNIKIADTIADNASASHYVLGHKPAKLETLDMINCEMKMYKNGELVSEGLGKNCLGSPINATLWLAQLMVDMGTPLCKGDLILTGALGPMVPVQKGDTFLAQIGGLGAVSVGFV